MSRALRLVAVAITIATAGFASAQLLPTPPPPPMPSPEPSTTQSPLSGPSTPTPSLAPSSTATLPPAVLTIPAGRSTWRSQDGSVVDLTIDPATGTLTGTFTPGFPCGLSTPPTTPARPVVGTVSGNAVAWTLSLSACPSVGTWIGHYQTAGTEEQLAVLWTLAVPESPPGVGSVLSGSALFVRQVTR